MLQPAEKDNDSMHKEIGSIRESLMEVKTTLSKMAEYLERLTRLEERHASTASSLERAFGAITKIEARVAALEQHNPIQKLVSGWVINGVWATAGLAAALVMKHWGVM